MAEGEHLGAELRIGAGADEDEASNEADELVGEAEKHAGGSCPIPPTIRGPHSWLSPRGVTPGQRLTAPIQLTPQGLRHTPDLSDRRRRWWPRGPHRGAVCRAEEVEAISQTAYMKT